MINKSSKELIELCDWINQSLLELSSTLEYKHTAKQKTKTTVGTLTNLSLDLKHFLLFNGDVNGNECLDAFELIMKLYNKLYDKNNRIRNSIYEKE